MGAVSLTGSDTLTINNYLFVGLADGNCVELTFPNDVAQVKTGKNGNVIFGLNESGRQGESTVRVLRGSDDDKFLNNLLAQQLANFAGTVLNIGQYIKKVGNGLGAIASDTYIVSSGVIQKQPEAKTNVEGETEQSVTIWKLRWGNVVRVIT
jgi:hypothetical protein